MNSIASLKSYIAKEPIKVCSFDLFDTLLLRPSVFSGDFFSIVGRKAGIERYYETMRGNSESAARQNKLFFKEEIEYDSIFREMAAMYDLSAEDVANLKDAEMDCDYRYLTCRKSIKDVLTYAKSLGKTVIITTDIFYPRAFIEKLLKKNDIDYDRLYVSSEYGLTKSSGHLYQQIVKDFEELGVKKDEILHIGDNENSDFAAAKKVGLRVEPIKRAEVIANSDDTFKRLRRYSERMCDNEFLLGVSINMLYDDPYTVLNKKLFPFISDMNAVNVLLLAPMVFAYAKWVIDDCIAHGEKTLLFLGEEGLLLEKVMRLLLNVYDNKIELVRKPVDKGLCNTLDTNAFLQFMMKSNIDPKMTIRKFIETYLKSADFDYYFEPFSEVGYSSLDMYIGPKENYLSILGILQQKAESKNEALRRKNYETLEDTLSASAIYTNLYLDFINRYKDRPTHGIYTLFENNTCTTMPLKYLVQFGDVYGRDLKGLKAFICHIFDLGATNLAPLDANIAKTIESYASAFVEIFGEDVKLLDFNIYQYYEFMRIAFYEYPPFVLKKEVLR